MILYSRISRELKHKKTNILAQRLQITRSAAAIEFWKDHIENSIIAIGNAPTALFYLIEKIHTGALPNPAAIIGMPVGFIGALESKETLIQYANNNNIPFITLRGHFGGSAVTCATINALSKLAYNQKVKI